MVVVAIVISEDAPVNPAMLLAALVVYENRLGDEKASEDLVVVVAVVVVAIISSKYENKIGR